MSKCYLWQISKWQVRRIRQSLGYKASQLRYGASVREKNRAIRLAYCQKHVDAGTMFLTHVFSDESAVQIGKKGVVVYSKANDAAARTRQRSKHPAKVERERIELMPI